MYGPSGAESNLFFSGASYAVIHYYQNTFYSFSPTQFSSVSLGTMFQSHTSLMDLSFCLLGRFIYSQFIFTPYFPILSTRLNNFLPV